MLAFTCALSNTGRGRFPGHRCGHRRVGTVGVGVVEVQARQGYQGGREGLGDREVRLLPWGREVRLVQGVPSYQRVQVGRVWRALVVVVAAVVVVGVVVEVADSRRRYMPGRTRRGIRGDTGSRFFCMLGREVKCLDRNFDAFAHT